MVTDTDIEQFMESYRPVLRRLAYRYQNHLNPAEDLQQEGLASAVRSAQTYDPDKGKLSSHLLISYKGGILNALRDRGHILNVSRGMEAPRMSNLDEPLHNDSAGEREDVTTLLDILPNPNDGFDEIDEQCEVDIESLMANCLSTRQQDVLRGLFWQGKSQRQIAEDIGGSQMRVSRDLKAALRTLREALYGHA